MRFKSKLQDFGAMHHACAVIQGHHNNVHFIAQELLRQTDREARAASGLKKEVAACEGKLREAASGQSHQRQELSQKLHQAEDALRTAHARLKDRGRSSLLLEETAAAAEARAKKFEAELASETAARAANNAAAEAAKKELEKARAAWESERATMSARAAGVAEAGKKMVEELEGALAECKGRVTGLGEGCGRCWQMLDEAQASGILCFLVHAIFCMGVMTRKY
jgi:DNA repair exonuclease SbcCD ATPase subunit